MRYVLGLGVMTVVVVACGGGVSVGDGSQALGKAAEQAESATGTGSATQKDCSAPGACGPALGLATKQCSDGSIGGNTGKCTQTALGGCGWEIRACPADPPAACFDKDGELDAAMRTCSTNEDCAVVTFQQNCCGTMRAVGVNVASQKNAQTCGDARAKGFAACECANLGTLADDGSTSIEDAPPSVSCSVAKRCETTFKPSGSVCGKATCQKGQTCCEGMPFRTPTCVDGNMCPVSRREYKKDISYLAERDRQELREDLMRTKLATYHYKGEAGEERKHLGFIINDMGEASPAVEADKQHVDLYGYTSMTVATLQLQQQQIASLEKQVAELRRELAAKPVTDLRRELSATRR